MEDSQAGETKTVVKPFSDEGSKRAQVEEMFDRISHRYDFLNHFLSLGIDRRWRKRAISQLREQQPKRILDVATGTGDLAIAALALKPDEVLGIDISEKMLEVGRKKLNKMGIQNIVLSKEDSAELSFSDQSFDAVTVAFGVRNFEDLEAGLREMNRVLKLGGRLVILEFSKPSMFPVKQLFNLYSKYLLPLWGKIFSGSEAAYRYLPESVKHFPEGPALASILTQCGYHVIRIERLTFGICSLYVADKA